MHVALDFSKRVQEANVFEIMYLSTFPCHGEKHAHLNVYRGSRAHEAHIVVPFFLANLTAFPRITLKGAIFLLSKIRVGPAGK